MKTVGQALRFFLIGALFGTVLGALSAPAVARALHIRVATMCDCTELMDLITTTFWTVQGGGFVLGGIGGLVFWGFLRKRGKLRTPL